MTDRLAELNRLRAEFKAAMGEAWKSHDHESECCCFIWIQNCDREIEAERQKTFRGSTNEPEAGT